MIQIDASDLRKLERANEKFACVQRGGYRNAILGSVQERVDTSAATLIPRHAVIRGVQMRGDRVWSGLAVIQPRH
jgi:hypothetical protein